MSDTSPTYRKHFASAARAEEYEDVHLAGGSYADLLWEIEKEQLAAELSELRRTHSHIDYLDFATGTGRIIAFMEDKVDTATGIDIAQAMVDRAAGRLTRARMICRDITSDDAEPDERYDLITAFRFVLNAEPSLRLAAMRALARRLRDGTSRLIFNNHGNPVSHKMLVWPYHRLRRIGRGYQPEGNYMTNREARRLAHEAGLTIERSLGCGLLSGKSLKLLSYGRVLPLERRLARSRLFQPLGVHQIYVARRK